MLSSNEGLKLDTLALESFNGVNLTSSTCLIPNSVFPLQLVNQNESGLIRVKKISWFTFTIQLDFTTILGTTLPAEPFELTGLSRNRVKSLLGMRKPLLGDSSKASLDRTPDAILIFVLKARF